jgi:serine/threonine protein kinase
MIIPRTELVAIHEGREIFREVLPPGEYEIGRADDSRICLKGSEKVSRRHAVLRLNYFDWIIEDIGSSNGTEVAGTIIAEATFIFPQQDVRVGDVEIHLRRLRRDDADGSLAPQAEAALKFLPTEIRGERKYKIRGIIAIGGMGVVLEAIDASTNRVVAMKTVLSTDTEETVARFVDEAQITAQLEHPNIVPVYELNVNELDKPFFVMKLVRGESLKHVLQALRLERPKIVERYPLSELLTIFIKVCDAVAYAHSRGVVHRDLKPENVMLGEFGEVLVMDWGLAKPLGRDANWNAEVTDSPMVETLRKRFPSAIQTGSGATLGTFGFMSPEQAGGFSSEVDARADIYALGGILYNLLTLQPPVDGKDEEEMRTRILSGQITPPRQAIANHPPPHLKEGKLPARLLEIVLQAMALSPFDRHATVSALRAEVQDYLFGETNRSFRGGNGIKARK